MGTLKPWDIEGSVIFALDRSLQSEVLTWTHFKKELFYSFVTLEAFHSKNDVFIEDRMSIFIRII